MQHWICQTCGVQYEATPAQPEHCPVCEDERQFVRWAGQAWTTLEQLRQTHTNRIEDEDEHLVGIGTVPDFAIGQRALLVQTPAGNVLWDCITLIDQQTVDEVQRRGGIEAIAISHPHYYSAMAEWSQAFGGVPIYLHVADRAWVMRSDPAIRYWTGPTQEILPGLTLIHLGGHFAGGAALHWAGGAEGKGALLTGDIIQVVPDRRYVSFMYSYPNLIPLPAREVGRIVDTLESFEFERLYGAWWGRRVIRDAKNAVIRSAARYIAALA